MNNPFLTKKDSLVEAVQIAMQDGEIRRQAEALVNEEFGVYSRKAVVREQLAAYDARLEEAYKCMKEGEKKDEKKEDKPKADYSKMREKMVGKGKDLETTRKIVGEAKKLADKDYDKDGKIESPKDEVWGSRFRAAKMAGKMEEEQIDEISRTTLKSYVKKADRQAANLERKVERRKDRPGEEDKMYKRIEGASLARRKMGVRVAASYNKGYSPEDLAKHGGRGGAAPKKKMDEEQINELKAPTAKTAHAAYDRAERSDDIEGDWKRSNRLYSYLKKKYPGKSGRNQKPTGKADLPSVSNTEFHKDGYPGRVTKKGKLTKSATKDTKADIKSRLGRHTKPNLPEETQIDEAAYSAKAARAGKDIGKPGKMFSKIAKKAGERYGSEERGKKVAGAILKRIRAKHMKEENLEELSQFGSAFAAARKSGQTQFSFGGKSYSTAMKGQSSTPSPKPATTSVPTPTPRPTMASDLPTIDKGPAPGPASTPQSAIAAAAAKKTASPMPPSRPANLGKPEPGAEASKFVRSQMNESVQVGENKYRIV